MPREKFAMTARLTEKKEKNNNNKKEKTMTTISIQHEQFRDDLKQLKPFMSNEETRYYICSIYIQKIGSELVLVATNGHILGERKIALIEQEVANVDDFTFLLSSVDVNNLIKILPTDKEAHIQFTYNEQTKTALFDTFHFQYSCKELDGRFPDYKNVIPITKHQLNLPAANSTYIAAAIKAIGKNKFVDIGFIDETAPFIMSAGTDADFKCVIMPVRTELSMQIESTPLEKAIEASA